MYRYRDNMMETRKEVTFTDAEGDLQRQLNCPKVEKRLISDVTGDLILGLYSWFSAKVTLLKLLCSIEQGNASTDFSIHSHEHNEKYVLTLALSDTILQFDTQSCWRANAFKELVRPTWISP